MGLAFHNLGHYSLCPVEGSRPTTLRQRRTSTSSGPRQAPRATASPSVPTTPAVLPQGQRSLWRQTFLAHQLNVSTGEWVRKEQPVPSNFHSWYRCWKCFRTGMLLLEAAEAERMDQLLRIHPPQPGHPVWWWSLVLHCPGRQSHAWRALGAIEEAVEGRTNVWVHRGTSVVGMLSVAIREGSFWNRELSTPATLFLARNKREVATDDPEGAPSKPASSPPKRTKTRAVVGLQEPSMHQWTSNGWGESSTERQNQEAQEPTRRSAPTWLMTQIASCFRLGWITELLLDSPRTGVFPDLLDNYIQRGSCHTASFVEEAERELGRKPVLNKLGVVVKHPASGKRKARIIWDLKEFSKKPKPTPNKGRTPRHCHARHRVLQSWPWCLIGRGWWACRLETTVSWLCLPEKAKTATRKSSSSTSECSAQAPAPPSGAATQPGLGDLAQASHPAPGFCQVGIERMTERPRIPESWFTPDGFDQPCGGSRHHCWGENRHLWRGPWRASSTTSKLPSQPMHPRGALGGVNNTPAECFWIPIPDAALTKFKATTGNSKYNAHFLGGSGTPNRIPNLATKVGIWSDGYGAVHAGKWEGQSGGFKRLGLRIFNRSGAASLRNQLAVSNSRRHQPGGRLLVKTVCTTTSWVATEPLRGAGCAIVGYLRLLARQGSMTWSWALSEQKCRGQHISQTSRQPHILAEFVWLCIHVQT